SGQAVAAVAFPATSRLVAEEAGGALSVSGVARPVLPAGLADWLILAATKGAGVVWCAIPRVAAAVTALASLDPTGRVYEVRLDGYAVPAEQVLSLDSEQASGLVASLAAAECAGGSGWCLDTASEYAKVREQFGRPIGQFQAVKHRCADMLVLTETARA